MRLRAAAMAGAAPWRWLPLAIVVAFLSVFLYYPLWRILSLSLGEGAGVIDTGAFGDVLGDGYFRGRFWFTFRLATYSTLLTLLLGVPSAYIYARYEFAGKTLLRAASTVPFVMPTIVVAFGFIALIGPEGVANDALRWAFRLDEPPIRLMNTLWIILLAHVFYNYAVVVRIVSALWANLDPRLDEAARTLGASPVRSVATVTLPLLAPAIASAALLVFLFSFTSFGVVLVLGGSKYATVEVEIYNLTAKLLDLRTAGALAVLQMAFTFVTMLAYARAQSATAAHIRLSPKRRGAARPSLRGWLAIAVHGALVLGLVLAPLLALVHRAFWDGDAYTLASFRSLNTNASGSYFFAPPTEAIRNSLLFAAATVALAVPIGTTAAYALAGPARGRGGWARSSVDALFMLPLGVSAVTLGFGYLVALDTGVLDLRDSRWVVVIAHTLIAYPFVMRAVLAVLRAIDPELREAAGVLGAGPFARFRWVDLPILSRAILVGAMFAFAISMGEFAATALLARPDWPTMPVVIFRSLARPGEAQFGQAMAMSAILMAVCAASFVLIERFRYRDIGEF